MNYVCNLEPLIEIIQDVKIDIKTLLSHKKEEARVKCNLEDLMKIIIKMEDLLI